MDVQGQQFPMTGEKAGGIDMSNLTSQFRPLGAFLNTDTKISAKKTVEP